MSRRTLFQTLLTLVTIIALLFVASPAFGQGNRDAAFERVKEVQQRHTEKLMAKAGVVGTAVGLGRGDQPAMLVLLEHGGVPGIPTELEGVPVRPLVTGKIYARPKPENPGGKDKPAKPGKPDGETNPKKRFDRPVPIGVSTGNVESCSAGTIGCRVTDGTNLYALSNNHVYALENTATPESEVLQPGLYDAKPPCRVKEGDVIGTLADYVDLDFTGGVNHVDAALARVDTTALGTATPVNGYGTPSSTTVDAYVGQAVQKYGRTTSLTHGTVEGINGSFWVTYDRGTIRFDKQIMITPGTFSSAGDSGSLIVTDDDARNPVGLLFAGSSTYTIANPIDDVLADLGVEIDDGQ